MAFWRLYYHLIWATKERHPLITATIEPELYGYIRGKAHHLGCIVQAINGVEDHIHLVVSIPPKLSIADFVGRIKGSSSHHLNHLPGNQQPQFAWQHGYGVLSLGSKQLEEAIAYVQRQKEHHARQTTIAALERDEAEDEGPAGAPDMPGDKLAADP